MKIMRDEFAQAMLLAAAIAVACTSGLPSAQAADQKQGSAEQKQGLLSKCMEAKAGGPEEVVRTLYKQYPFEGDKVIKNEPKEVLEKFLDGNLTALLLKNRECEIREEGLCNISFDVMYAAQDAKITNFRVCAMDSANTVRVQFRNFGKATVVKYKMTNTEAGWRISDILTSFDSGEFSLVRALSSD